MNQSQLARGHLMSEYYMRKIDTSSCATRNVITESNICHFPPIDIALKQIGGMLLQHSKGLKPSILPS